MSQLPYLRDPYLSPQQPTFLPTLLGPLEAVTPASDQVVTTAEAKAQCRVDISDDDTYIDSLVKAAQAFCEQEIYGHRQLLTAVYKVPVKCFWEGPLRLERPPLVSVGSVKYYDTTGTEQTLASTYYLVRTPLRQPGSVERAPQQVWPAVQCDRRYPVSITFTCGYGAASDVPQTIKQAVLLLVGHWYIHREAVGQQVGNEVEMAVRSLLASEGYGSY